jgi:type I restriction enzyme S subunit
MMRVEERSEPADDLKDNHNKYPEYKSTGAEWVGDIPEHWDFVKLNYLFDIISGTSPKSEYYTEKEEGLPFLQGNAEFGKLNPNPDRYCTDCPKKSKANDVLISVRAPVGDLNISDQEYGIGRGLNALRKRRGIEETKFVFYLMNVLTEGLELKLSGSTFNSVDRRDIASLRGPLPPAEEQKAIVNFLDQETEKIDQLIEQKERLIELLAEKREALITRAVTKGLDPDAEMKDSGVEWLGRIPSTWELEKIKRISSTITTGSTPKTSEDRFYDKDEIPWYGPASFSDNFAINEPSKHISFSAIEEGEAPLFEKDAVLIVIIGATAGKVAYMDHRGSANQQVVAVSFLSSIANEKYMAYQLKSLEHVFRELAPNTTLPNLNERKIKDFVCAVPSIKEQEKIVEHLDNETQQIDNFVERIRESIEVLTEYRKSLISHAVTGKIDVREEVNAN